jgi:hypothetical protein
VEHRYHQGFQYQIQCSQFWDAANGGREVEFTLRLGW